MNFGAIGMAVPVTLALAFPVDAQLAPPQPGPAGELRIATSAQLAPTLTREVRAFEKSHPEIRVTVAVRGSDVAMAAMYGGAADMAVIGREAADPELKAFEWIYRHPAGVWQVMRGSTATPGHSPTIAVIVNSANPVRGISLAQLKAIFLARETPRWRDLGVTGALGTQPIRLVIPDAMGGTGRYLRHTVLGDTTQLAWTRVREISAPPSSDLRDDGIEPRVAAFVARDRTALALAGATFARSTRLVPLLVDGVALSIDDPHYPLQRGVFAYADRQPRHEVRTFLDFILSDEGQAIATKGPYRALHPAER